MMVEENLASQLLGLFQSMHGDKPMTEKEYADKLAKIITDHVKTAEVQPGIPVATTGSQYAQSGSTTSTGKIQ